MKILLYETLNQEYFVGADVKLFLIYQKEIELSNYHIFVNVYN